MGVLILASHASRPRLHPGLWRRHSEIAAGASLGLLAAPLLPTDLVIYKCQAYDGISLKLFLVRVAIFAS